jgi:hypothetical protein
MHREALVRSEGPAPSRSSAIALQHATFEKVLGDGVGNSIREILAGTADDQRFEAAGTGNCSTETSVILWSGHDGGLLRTRKCTCTLCRTCGLMGRRSDPDSTPSCVVHGRVNAALSL